MQEAKEPRCCSHLSTVCLLEGSLTGSVMRMLMMGQRKSSGAPASSSSSSRWAEDARDTWTNILESEDDGERYLDCEFSQTGCKVRPANLCYNYTALFTDHFKLNKKQQSTVESALLLTATQCLQCLHSTLMRTLSVPVKSCLL